MRRRLLALTAGVLLLLAVGAGTATATEVPDQSSGQLAASEQGAGAAAGTAQSEPTNRNVSVRVLSPGDDGPVSQTNVATSDADATNVNGTEQSAAQAQGGSGLQAIGQSATSAQDAFALALTAQQGASNTNAPVRVLSEGDAGPVGQANVASSDADAANVNATDQSAGQLQAGGGCCGDAGSQSIGQSADSEQEAAALGATKQEKPSNTNISVRVLSPGDDGPVRQANVASSDATAGNANATKQVAGQLQAGDCKCGGSGSQSIGQSADSEQEAKAVALTEQEKPSNTNVSVRVLSPGSNGPVTQVNNATSNATAGNLNLTEQKAGQLDLGGSCKCGGSGTQSIGQHADSEQKATALSATKQEKPSNTNVSTRVLSPGDDGPVRQANVASSDATAGNLNVTKQAALQAQAGGSGLQLIGQAAKNEQDAAALGLTVQDGASNASTPVRVLSWGDGGPVSQANVATSDAAAGNVNWTEQKAHQLQGGGTSRGSHCCGLGIQAIGQLAKSDQKAAAAALTVQLGARHPCKCGDSGNASAPVRVLSPGADKGLHQLNAASSKAKAANWKAASQGAKQIDAAPCACLDPSIQAIGQQDVSEQLGLALGATLQHGASNAAAPAHTTGTGRPERKVMPYELE